MFLKSKNPKFCKFLQYSDKIVFAFGLVLLLFVIILLTRMNVAADSIDYYVILQRMTNPDEAPIVQNSHFVDQRSPGYCIFALIPYSMISFFVEPYAKTENIIEYNLVDSGSDKDKIRSSEMMFFPPVPLQINNFLFKDYYIPRENSWYRWKISLSMIITSIVFLFAGIFAICGLIKYYFKNFKGYSIVTLAIFCSPVFMINVVGFPLYATMTAFGLSSLFLLFLVISFDSNKRWQIIITGMFLGFLVLTRLELSLILFLLLGYYLLTRRFYFLSYTLVGGLIPFSIYIFYNFLNFGTPLYFGLLKGDINVIEFNVQYIFENLLHPQSGILFYTPILIPGLIFLFISKNKIFRFAGIAGFILIMFYTLRIPVMYLNTGQGVLNIGGIPVLSPENSEQARDMIRSDINRYVSVFIPFAILGVRLGISKIFKISKN